MNRNKSHFFLATVLLMVSQVLVAQTETVNHSNNKVSLNCKEYYIHIVRKGETLSAISRAYELPIDSIIADNPQLTYQIHPDQYIRIRVKKEAKSAEPCTKQTTTCTKTRRNSTPYILN